MNPYKIKALSRLETAIRAVCPITGISGDVDDRLNIRIDFQIQASEEDKSAARQVLEGFDVSEPPIPSLGNFKLAIFQSETVSPLAKVMIPLTYSQLDANINTPAILQAYWSGLKQVPQLFGTDEKTCTTIEGLAVQFNIPIVEDSHESLE